MEPSRTFEEVARLLGLVPHLTRRRPKWCLSVAVRPQSSRTVSVEPQHWARTSTAQLRLTKS